MLYYFQPWMIWGAITVVFSIKTTNHHKFTNWRCGRGCVDGDNATSIFRHVHRAIKQNSVRELYLLLDHSWIDHLLEPSTRVVVNVIPRQLLSTTKLLQQDSEPIKEGEERYIVVYSPPVEQHRLKGGYSVLMKNEAIMMDTFLAMNPCFIPLHDPPVTLDDSQKQPLGPLSFNSKNKGHSTVTTDGMTRSTQQELLDYEHSAIFIRLPSYPYHATCKLYNIITILQHPSRCPEQFETELIEAHRLGNIGWVNNVYPLVTRFQTALRNGRVLITPRAEENGGEMTLEKQLFYRYDENGRQNYGFFSSTPTANNNVMYYSDAADFMFNFNISGVISTHVEWLQEAMNAKNGEFGNAAYWRNKDQERLNRKEPPSDTLYPVTGTWGAWADRQECPSLAHFIFDPWSCHFISLSICNYRPKLHDILPRKSPRNGYPDTPQQVNSLYFKTLQEINLDRQQYLDGIQLKHVWEFSRLLTFIHRPNIFTRANLRNALELLVKMSSTKSGTTKDSTSKDSHREGNLQQPLSSSSSSSSSSSGTPQLSNNTDVDFSPSDGSMDTMDKGMHQCVGIHVRHGDSNNDIRARSKLDRSLSAHLSCAQQMIKDHSVLMDSPTTMSNITTGKGKETKMIPGLGQTKRHIQSLTTVYMATDNNTLYTLAPHDYPNITWYKQQRELNDYTGGSFQYRNQKSANREIANLLADMIFLTRCDGLIIASDGGLAHMFFLASYARRINGSYPLYKDLWQCQPDVLNNQLPPIAKNNTNNMTSLSSPPPVFPIPYRFMTDPMLTPIWFEKLPEEKPMTTTKHIAITNSFYFWMGLPHVFITIILVIMIVVIVGILLMRKRVTHFGR